MVLWVPDEDDPLAGDEVAEEQGEKATLDESDIKDGTGEDVPRALQKVELDLDDAPFLEEEEKEEEPEEAEAPAEEGVEEEKKRRLPALLANKKVLILLAVILLAVIGLLLYFLLRPAEPPPPPPEKTPVQEEPAEKAPEEPEPVTVRMEPFWVEKTDLNGKVRFLHIQFALEVQGGEAEREIRDKKLVLRDAVYYYLVNKEFAFLADTENLELLKRDVLSVVNKFLGNQPENLLIEQYLVQ
ncbi:flagellar basal body-associated FliL family protein [Desulfohalovibrio reitneri]|uniref:flagellar basal body-associated FliL family protein n=1 Tax=Desulfohalovibrio reitneri TaxID=1307759 RepID=UPI0004A74EFA|nr:flagellar basal body-associated FliL family protein [Desulfohalovibrio reitneri]